MFFSDEMQTALQNLEEGNYEEVNSLFRSLEKQYPSYYFLKTLTQVCNFAIDGNKDYQRLAGKRFSRAEVDSYAFKVLPASDHLIFEFNYSRNKVYPMSEGWLMNYTSLQNKYKVSELLEGFKIDRYEYDDTLGDYKKMNSYIESPNLSGSN